MRLFFVLPGLSEKYRCGGLMVTRRLAELLGKLPGFQTALITTHERHPEAVFFDDFLAPQDDQAIFIVTWGPLVAEHIRAIRKKNTAARIVYYAQSFGWGVKIPPRVPIVCVSRFVMAQWALHATENFIGYAPPPLMPCFAFHEGPRDIDLLIHTRKQNEYCLQKLLPELEGAGLKIKVLAGWIPQEEFAALLKRTKIFLYVTQLHKTRLGRTLPGEGFGLPALEALACGAVVGSNLLGGVTDFLTPGENCIKLHNGDLEADIRRIQGALADFHPNKEAAQKIEEAYAPARVQELWRRFFAQNFSIE